MTKEPRSLEQLIGYHAAFAQSDAIIGALQGEDITIKEKARDALKLYLQSNGVLVDHEVPLPDETYEKNALSLRNETDKIRKGFYFEHKGEVLSSIPEDKLKEGVLLITPVEIKNNKSHNRAYDAHLGLLKISQALEAVGSGKAPGGILYDAVGKAIPEIIRMRYDSQEVSKYLDDKDVKMAANAAKSALYASERVLIGSAGLVRHLRLQQFEAAFDDSYKKATYALETLRAQKDAGTAVGDIARLMTNGK